MTAFEQTILEIADGKHDAKLSHLLIVIRNRQNAANPKPKLFDTVAFNSNTRPAYLIGQRARVLKLNPKKARVQLRQPIGRFSGVINAPYSLLTVVK